MSPSPALFLLLLLFARKALVHLRFFVALLQRFSFFFFFLLFFSFFLFFFLPSILSFVSVIVAAASLKCLGAAQPNTCP